MGAIQSHLNSIIELCESRVSNLGAFCLGTLALLVLVDVFTRLVGKPIFFGVEVAGYLMVALVFLTGAEALRLGQFIRVDLIISRLSDRRRKLVLLVSNTVALFFISLVSFYSWQMLIATYSSGRCSETSLEAPIYLTQIVVPVGLTFITIRLLIETYKLATALKGRR